METPKLLIESLWESTEDYVKTTFELSKLKALETTIVVVTSMVTKASITIVISLFIFVFTIGIAFLLGDLLGKIYFGFFIVAAFYLIASIILYFFLNNWIKNVISNIIIDQALS